MLNTLTIDNKVLSYDDTLKFAKKIDPENFMDITHDFLLDGGNLKSLKFNYKTTSVQDYTKIIETYNTCNICNEIKPVAMFNIIQRNGLKYLGNQCKDCLKKKTSMWIKLNYEKFRSCQRRYRAKNKNRIKLLQRIWYLNNKDYLKLYRNDYYEAKRNEILAHLKEKYKSDMHYRKARINYSKQWSLDNFDKVRTYRKKYDKSQKGIERTKKYKQANTEKIKAYQKKYRLSDKGREAKKRYDKNYAEKNSEKIKAYQKQYREKKKLEKLNKIYDHETTH